MHPEAFAFHLDPSGRRPVYLQLADAMAAAIHQGRIRPGDALPGSRAFARTLGINRLTVLSAYRELEGQGLVRTSERSGTFVADVLPVAALSRKERPDGSPGFDWPAKLGPLTEQGFSGALDLREGHSDLRLFMVQSLGRAYRRGLQRKARELLLGADPLGYPPCRRLLARWLGERRGLTVSERELLLVGSLQSAVELVARLIVEPDEAIALEDPGDRKLWETLHHARFDLVPVPVDREGLQVEALEALLKTRRIRLVCTTPHVQHPTTVSMSPARRKALLDLAQAHRLAVIENDLELGLSFEGHLRPSLASEDPSSCVIYLGNLARVVAKGFRLAFLAGPGPFIEQLGRLQAKLGWQSDFVLEYAVAELLEDGDLQRHMLKIQYAFRGRLNALARALRSELGDTLEFSLPSGGTSLWVQATRPLDWDAWIHGSRKESVLIHPPQRWALGPGPRNGTSLGFAAHTPEELECAVELMRKSLPEC